MAEPTQLSPAPLQSPVFDRTGRMTAEWQRYFMQLFAVSANVATSLVTITDSVTDVADSAALDTRNARDVSAIAEEAAAQVPAASPRDFTPLIEEALLLSPAPSVRDYTPDIEAAVRSVLQDARTPRVVPADLDDIYSRLACLESPNRGSASNAAVTDFDAAGAAEEIGRQQAQPFFRDYTPDIEAAVRSVLQDARTPRVVPADLDDIYSRLACLESPNRGSASNAAITDFDAAGAAEEISRQQAQPLFKDYGPDIEAAVRSVLLEDGSTSQVRLSDLDEMRSLIASLDTPRANGFEGWQNWTPTYSCSGAMTFALASTAFAVFLRVGSTVFFAIQVNFTLGGTANIAVFATLPVPGVGVGVGGGNMSVNCNIINGGTAPWVPSFGYVDAGNQRLNVATPTAANWTLGGAWFSCQGFYQIK